MRKVTGGTILAVFCLGLSSGDAYAQEVEVEYDKFTDTTTVKTEALGTDDPFVVVGLFNCEGDRVCQPNNIYLVFAKGTDELRYQDEPRVIFLLDGDTRLRPDNVTAGRDYSSGQWTEIVQIPVSQSELSDIVGANTVEYQIESTSGALTGEQKLGLQRLYEKIPVDQTSSMDSVDISIPDTSSNRIN